MRAFVAIDIPAEIRARIEEFLRELTRIPGDLRWSRPEGLHITLKFLGEVPGERVDVVKTQLQALPPQPPVAVRIAGSGFFPNERAPRVLWLGIEAEPELARLAAVIDQSMSAVGVPKEDRAYNPHLTLARLRSTDGIAPIREMLERRAPLDFGSFIAREFSLYESRLAPGGSVYTKLERYTLTTERSGGPV
jgi:RNA 2',3'-cyclic 3'-phosphodiesterase